MGVEHGGEQRAVAAAHVDDPVEPIEPAGGGDPRSGVAGALGHGAVEHRLELGVLLHVLERGRAGDPVPRGFAGADRLAELAPRAPHPVAGEQQDEVEQRDRSVGQQARSVGPEGPGAGLGLGRRCRSRRALAARGRARVRRSRSRRPGRPWSGARWPGGRRSAAWRRRGAPGSGRSRTAAGRGRPARLPGRGRWRRPPRRSSRSSCPDRTKGRAAAAWTYATGVRLPRGGCGQPGAVSRRSS